MPKSKRNKQIELSKTKKRGLPWKKHLFEEVRSCVDKYENVFIFSVNDMRNSKMKTVREQWKHSRFFIGKNKIIAMALGRFSEEEYKPNLHKLGQQIKGQRGLLFSNKPVEDVLNWFRSYSEGDYARSGNTASETVNLTAGPLTMFPHNLEPYLRQLGLPTSLEKGVIHLTRDHEVCKAGDTLTPETAKILKLLGYEMAEFHITIDCVWSQDGSFTQFTESVHTDAEEKKKKVKKSSLGSKPVEITDSPDMENMEIELDAEESSSDSEDEVVNSASDTKSDLSRTPLGNTNGTSPKEKNNGFVENDVPDLQVECSKSVTDCRIDEDRITSTKRGRPRSVAKTPKLSKAGTKKEKRESLVKTPDANTSQDSPIFRELRNRSVKFSRKKK